MSHAGRFQKLHHVKIMQLNCKGGRGRTEGNLLLNFIFLYFNEQLIVEFETGSISVTKAMLQTSFPNEFHLFIPTKPAGPGGI